MFEPTLAITQTTGVFVVTLCVLASAVTLSILAINKDDANQKFLAGIIGLLLGLFSAGGIGALFADKAADDAADNVKEQVKDQVQQAQDQGAAGN
jgi:hypothetical protein